MQNRIVINWIYTFSIIVAFLIVFGGLVRLTRSGLSIVEWNPVYGIIPPLNEAQWLLEFGKYQLSPEFIHVNSNITLDQYKSIYLLEWAHRLIARFAGLVFAIPFFIFLFTKKIRLKDSAQFVVMGLLFIAQAVMGWIMVSSGLVDRPAVSHFALAAHLMLAFTLLALATWVALSLKHGSISVNSRWSVSSKLFIAILAALILEIFYGALTAGLKAGHVSNTWPLMLGKLVPDGMLSQFESPLLNFLESPLTIMFMHRWLAFFVLLITAIFCFVNRKSKFSSDVKLGLRLVLTLIGIQILIGILVVVNDVQIVLALSHQANAIILFLVSIYTLHRLRAADSENSSLD